MAVIALLAACGSRHGTEPVAPNQQIAAKLPSGPPLVTPGERMSYVLKLGGMTLGTLDLGVGDVTSVDGKSAVAVVGHAKSSGLASIVSNVDDNYTSWIDTDTGRPLRWIVEEHTKDEAAVEKTDAHLANRTGNVVPVDVWVGDKQLSEPQTVSMPEVWDYYSYLVALRAWEAPRGASVDAEVFRSRYMWHVKTTIAGKETLATELGDLPALKMEGVSYRVNRDGTRDKSIEERSFTIWISDDSGRVPLQTIAHTDYGEVTLAIVDYQSGSGQPLRQ